MLLAILLTFVLMVSGADRVTADIIRVPGDFPTIQQAVDHSSPGDEIVIDAGTYLENVSIIGRDDLRLRSQSGPAFTVVDGSFLDAVFFIEYCQRITIEGLGIRRGETGIRVHDSGPVRVAGCIIEENVSLGDGGGFWIVGSNITIEDNRIVNNAANMSAGLDGGGLYCFVVSGEIRGNLIAGNQAHEGGAVIINEATTPALLVTGNVIWGNEASYFGGGIYVNRGTHPEIRNNTLAGNQAGVSGGGVWYTEQSDPVIANNIIAGNTAPDGGGVHAFLPGVAPAFACNDVFGNPGGDYTGYVNNPTGTEGNISADPQFCNLALNDYRLHEDSPCAPAHSPAGCGLIGALDVGCGVIAVEPTTWGAVKSRYSTAKRPAGQ